MPTPDPGTEWTGGVGATWAREWRRTDRSFAALTGRLLDPAAIGVFTAALDIGCGAGELACSLASRAPAATVRGIDISASLLAVARERAAGLANLAFEEADAARWAAPPGFRPDLLVSRHGVMFFAEPAAAFSHLRALAAPGARLRFSCFRAREENGWYQALAAALPAPVAEGNPDAPGPFAFADKTRVDAILAEGGWSDIDFEAVDYPMIAGEGEGAEAEADAYFQHIGPVARALRDLPEAGRSAALAGLAKVVSDHHSDSRVALPAAGWIVTARARPA